VTGSSKLVYGVGVNDWDGNIWIGGKSIPEYRLWANMLRRCFDDKYKQKHPTYSDVTCSKEWLSMTKFVEDISQMKGFGFDEWSLDKDILQKGNKLYSKNTCCFVPQEINKLLTKSDKTRGECPIGVRLDKRLDRFKAEISTEGKRMHLGYFTTPEEAFQAYKTAKEAHIKAVATKWKDQLDERVYQALLNYTVDITD